MAENNNPTWQDTMGPPFEEPENPEYDVAAIQKTTTDTPAHAEVFNSIFQKLVNNTAAVKKLAESRAEAVPEFEQAEILENINSGDTMTGILGKLKKWFASLRQVAWSGEYSDLENIPSAFPPASHTHNYAGSNSAGGVANSATKLATARSFQVNLGSTSAVNFDGTANATPGVTGTLGIANGGLGNTTGRVTAGSGDPFNPPGSYATAEGYMTKATGKYSHAEGLMVSALEEGSHAEGYSTTASGKHSHAEGNLTTASGEGSHAEGGRAAAKGGDSHAEGEATVAEGGNSHAEGYMTKATGTESHAEGNGTTASGWGSHAEGIDTVAAGQSSHAAGNSTIAEYKAETAVGTYNRKFSPSSSTTLGNLFSVGKGNSESARANAFRVNRNGVYGTAAFNASGADYAELFEWADRNPQQEDRVGHFVTLDGEKIRIASPTDKYVLGIVSGNPSVVGDVHDDQWAGMFETDIFGRPVWEDVDLPAETREDPDPKHPGQTITREIIPARTEHRQKVNPKYDHTQKYIPRTERPEWDAVGLLGKLVAVDDGSCQMNGWCKVGEGGIAVHSEQCTPYRVMTRLDETHIRVLILPSC